MAVNNLYVVDMTSWGTASRTYRLPTTASAGDKIGITITKGNANHELAIRSTIGSGDTINGVDHDADDWSRLFQAGETVIMECTTADSDWIVTTDGRKAAKARVRRSTTAQTVAESAFDQIEFDTEDYNYGLTVDTTTGYNITVRRDGIYNLNSLLLFDPDTPDVLINLYKNGSRVNTGFVSTEGGRDGVTVFNGDIDLVAGDDVEIWTYAYGPRSTSTNSAKSSYFSVSEIL